MPSPYVRRRRLATEIRKIREERGLTVQQFARLVYLTPTKVTRLENAGGRPDVALIMNMLDRLEIGGSRYDRLLRLARDAAEKGWWDRYGMSMGPRQKIYCDLEYSADTIRDYNQTMMPAVLQAPQFISALVDLDRCQGPLGYLPERMTQARLQRQRELLRPDGPSYETVIDEYGIRRLAVPSEVMAVQLQHMATVASEEERVTVRVLPHNARVPGGFPPMSPFYLFTFPEAEDPPLAVLETVTTDVILTHRREIARYTATYDRLRQASLSAEDSITFLKQVANHFAEQTVSET